MPASKAFLRRHDTKPGKSSAVLLSICKWQFCAINPRSRKLCQKSTNTANRTSAPSGLQRPFYWVLTIVASKELLLAEQYAGRIIAWTIGSVDG